MVRVRIAEKRFSCVDLNKDQRASLLIGSTILKATINEISAIKSVEIETGLGCRD